MKLPAFIDTETGQITSSDGCPRYSAPPKDTAAGSIGVFFSALSISLATYLLTAAFLAETALGSPLDCLTSVLGLAGLGMLAVISLLRAGEGQ